MKPKVSIIILNWNGWKDTTECLESLHRIDYPNYNVIIVDNKSEDNSLDMIRRYCQGQLVVKSEFFIYDPKNKPFNIVEYSKDEIEYFKLDHDFDESLRNIYIIKNDQNYGFAQGNNIGINFALKNLDPEYVLLLNNDTVVDKRFLDELIQFNDTDEKIGFSGPKTYYYNYNGSSNVLDFAGGKINLLKGEAIRLGEKELDNGQYNLPMIVDYIQGSCLLIKRDVLSDIGLLNPYYFTYWEESDLCLRGLRKGYKSFYVPSAKIWHKSGVSSVVDTKIYYFTRNQLWFIREHTTPLQYTTFLTYFFGYRFWYSLSIYSIYHHDLQLLKTFLAGVYSGLKDNDYESFKH